MLLSHGLRAASLIWKFEFQKLNEMLDMWTWSHEFGSNLFVDLIKFGIKPNDCLGICYIISLFVC